MADNIAVGDDNVLMVGVFKVEDNTRDAIGRIQVLMWLHEGAHCVQCGHVYKSYDDFMGRDPRAAADWRRCTADERFVDAACLDALLASRAGVQTAPRRFVL